MNFLKSLGKRLSSALNEYAKEAAKNEGKTSFADPPPPPKLKKKRKIRRGKKLIKKNGFQYELVEDY